MENAGEQQPNPVKDELAYAIGRILGEGYVLTNTDIRMMAPYYGANPNSTSDLMYSPGARRIMGEVDVIPLRKDYKGHKVYVDGDRDTKPGELHKTYKLIDQKRSKVGRAKT
jgi:hypothetical protein